MIKSNRATKVTVFVLLLSLLLVACNTQTGTTGSYASGSGRTGLC